MRPRVKVFEVYGVPFAVIVIRAHEKEENDLIKNFINKNILQGQTNIRLFADKPLDRSTYYKYKNKFVDIIYHCCISKGFVTLEEILEEKIA